MEIMLINLNTTLVKVQLLKGGTRRLKQFYLNTTLVKVQSCKFSIFLFYFALEIL